MNGAYGRLVVYCLIAGITAWIVNLADYTDEQIAQWSWIKWSTFVGAIALQVLYVLKAYTSGSWAEYVKNQNGSLPAPKPIPPPPGLAPPVMPAEPPKPTEKPV